MAELEPQSVGTVVEFYISEEFSALYEIFEGFEFIFLTNLFVNK